MNEKTGWICNNKRVLQLVLAASIFFCATELIYYSSAEKATLKSLPFAIFILPWILGFAVIFAFWHEGLYGAEKTGIVIALQKIFFWLVLSVFIFILASILYRFFL